MGGWDTDLDDGSSNYDIHDNHLLNGGLKFREGYRRSGNNNIIIENSLHPHFWYSQCHDVFQHNIVMGAYKPAIMHVWDAKLDNNLFTTTKRTA